MPCFAEAVMPSANLLQRKIPNFLFPANILNQDICIRPNYSVAFVYFAENYFYF